MPLLAPQLISTWYLFQQNLNNQSLIRIVEDWTEQQTQDLNEKKLIQGSNGTHVMDVGGIIWENTVRAPVLIINQATGYSSRYTDIFDLLSYSFNATRSPFLDPTLTFLMQSACKATLETFVPLVYSPLLSLRGLAYVPIVSSFYFKMLVFMFWLHSALNIFWNNHKSLIIKVKNVLM